jgi:hypothetical protein
LARAQALLQNPQWAVDDSTLVSHAEASPSQSPSPAPHGDETQRPEEQIRPPPHTPVQPPQAIGSFSRSASQPLFGLPSQSEKPLEHAGEQRASTQAATA